MMRPPFNFALCGEFVPPSDPDQRQQSLARLAFTAYAEGERVKAPQPVRGRSYARRHYPAWAPGIQVDAFATAHGPIHRLVGLTVASEEADWFTITDTSTSYGLSLEIEQPDSAPVQVLQLEYFPSDARRKVTDIAEAFFANVPYAPLD
jgi:hypothetical protein